MFNASPKVQLLEIPGRYPCVVIDDALTDPQALVDAAIQNQGAFVRAAEGGFPGLELRMPEAFSHRLNEFFLLHARHHLGARRTVSNYSRLSLVARPPSELTPLQRVCHRDYVSLDPRHCMSACVLYLFRDPALGGTSFFRPRRSNEETTRLLGQWAAMSQSQFTQALGLEPQYPTTSNPYFERVCTVPAAWNRIIFYDSTVFHSGDIAQPERLDPNPAVGRLTLNGFFVCRPAADAGI